MELPSGLALSRWCRQSCPALHQEAGAGLWREYLTHMFGDISVGDELSAGSQSLAEHIESSRWLGQVAGLKKHRLKLNSTAFPHVPCCSSACTSRPLHASLSMLPIPLCTCPKARSTCIGPDGFFSGAGRLCGSHWSVPSGVNAAHPVPQGSCLFFGHSGLWAVTPPSSCACSKLIFQLLQIWSASHVTPTGPFGSEAAAWLSWEQEASLQKVLDVGFRLFPGRRSFLGKYKTSFKLMCLTAAHASAMHNMQDTSSFCKHC